MSNSGILSKEDALNNEYGKSISVTNTNFNNKKSE